MNSIPIIIIRATHRLMMSRAVDEHVARVERSRRGSSPPASRGSANGHSADENHVSSTSGSRSSSPEPHVAQASGSAAATVSWPFGQYQTGI